MGLPKGRTNNPGGKYKLPKDWIERYHYKTPKVMDFLVKVIEDDEQDTGDRLKAADMLLNRLWGKPAQTVNTTVTGAGAIPKLVINLSGPVDGPKEIEGIVIETPSLVVSED